MVESQAGGLAHGEALWTQMPTPTPVGVALFLGFLQSDSGSYEGGSSVTGSLGLRSLPSHGHQGP